MANRPADLSADAFQQKCIDGCARILGPDWVAGRLFERVHGRGVDYWRAQGRCGEVEVQVFVYPDGAEFGLDGEREVHVYEWTDFDGLEALAGRFLRELGAAVEGQR